jgi:KUP system potassium uptake protein
MGEILYPMVKCRPDISTHAILLSQFINNPGEVHYIALKQLATYLIATKSEGIHYWRCQPHPTLPDSPLPALHADNYDIKELRGTNSTSLIGFVDSDWPKNTKKRTSMTGMILMYSGGAIGYKSKFQTVIAHSSTEAEFMAACDTAKLILFF